MSSGQILSVVGGRWAGSSTSSTSSFIKTDGGGGEQSPSVSIRVTVQCRAGNSTWVFTLLPQCPFLFISLPNLPAVSANCSFLTTQLEIHASRLLLLNPDISVAVINVIFASHGFFLALRWTCKMAGTSLVVQRLRLCTPCAGAQV